MKNIKILTLFVFAFMVFASGIFAQVDKAEGLIKKGDYVGAVNALKDVVKSDNGYDANYLYGLALYKTGNVKDAETYLNKALAKDDEGVMALKTMGDLYSSKKQYDKALDDLNRAIELSPNNDNAYNTRGTVYWRKGNRQQAKADWRQALELNPDNKHAKNNLRSN